MAIGFMAAIEEANAGNKFPLAFEVDFYQEREAVAEFLEKLLEKKFSFPGRLSTLDFLYIAYSAKLPDAGRLAREYLAVVDAAVSESFGYLAQLLFSVHNLYPFSKELSALPSDENLMLAKIICDGTIADFFDFFDMRNICFNLEGKKNTVLVDDEKDDGCNGVDCPALQFYRNKVEPDFNIGYTSDAFLELVDQVNGEGVPETDRHILSKYISGKFHNYSMNIKRELIFLLAKIDHRTACKVAFGELNFLYQRALMDAEGLKRLVSLILKMETNYSEGNLLSLVDCRNKAFYLLNN